jgi:ankyrin repeat protein
VVQLLVELRVDKEVLDNRRRTALHTAAYKGHDATIRLLNSHFNANKAAKCSSGWTALHGVARTGQDAAVEPLVKLGVDIESKDNNRWTALQCAATGGHDTTVRLLLKHGANREAQSIDGATIDYCSLVGRQGKGCNASATYYELGFNSEARDDHGWTALHDAATTGHDSTILLLVGVGVDLEGKDSDGRTALYWAATS